MIPIPPPISSNVPADSPALPADRRADVARCSILPGSVCGPAVNVAVHNAATVHAEIDAAKTFGSPAIVCTSPPN